MDFLAAKDFGAGRTWKDLERITPPRLFGDLHPTAAKLPIPCMKEKERTWAVGRTLIIRAM